MTSVLKSRHRYFATASAYQLDSSKSLLLVQYHKALPYFVMKFLEQMTLYNELK